jgi:hypothetical protein
MIRDLTTLPTSDLARMAVERASNAIDWERLATQSVCGDDGQSEADCDRCIQDAFEALVRCVDELARRAQLWDAIDTMGDSK